MQLNHTKEIYKSITFGLLFGVFIFSFMIFCLLFRFLGVFLLAAVLQKCVTNDTSFFLSTLLKTSHMVYFLEGN